MTTTRSRRPLSAFAACAALVFLSACSPDAPPGADRDDLDDAVSRAIGDPSSCVLIAPRDGGRVLYRYNSATACAREYPACERPVAITVDDLLKVTVKDGRARRLSCDTAPDASRGVGWASGPIAGTDLVYAAVMEGDRVFPGRMIADRLEAAFRRAKVSKAP
jgi:hypothetical protein